MNGSLVTALIDTGSQVSLMSESLYRTHFSYLQMQSVESLMGDQVPQLRTVSGQKLAYKGAVEVYVTLGERMAGTNIGVHVLFLIMDDDVPTRPTHGVHFCLVGMNAIELFWEEKLKLKV